MSPLMKILTFVCLLHFLAYTTYGPKPRGKPRGKKFRASTSTTNYESRRGGYDDKNVEEAMLNLRIGEGSTSNPNDESLSYGFYDENEKTEEVFIENTPFDNFMHALRYLNKNSFEDQDGFDLKYFEALITSIPWDSMKTIFYNVEEFCDSPNVFTVTDENLVENTDLVLNCISVFQQLSFPSTGSQKDSFLKFYNDEIIDELYKIHEKDPEDPEDKKDIELVEIFFQAIIDSSLNNLDPRSLYPTVRVTFPSIENHCRNYLKLLMEQVAASDVDSLD